MGEGYSPLSLCWQCRRGALGSDGSAEETGNDTLCSGAWAEIAMGEALSNCRCEELTPWLLNCWPGALF